VNGLGTDQAVVTVSFVTANGASGAFFSGIGTGSTIPFFVVPPAQAQSTNYHQISVIASPAGSGAPTSFRYVFGFARAPTDRTVTLGPSLAATTVTSLATAPYLQLRAQVPSQSAYNGLAAATFSQTNRTVNVTRTAAFSGGAPANWTLDIPDLSAAGYDPTWALQRGAAVNWTAIAEGGDFLAFIGGVPADNAQIVAAGASGSTQAFVRFFRSYGIDPLRRP
jgi:hypothetical protein